MNYKQIETSREIRLWIGQIIIPAVVLTVGTMVTVPGAKEFVVKKAKSLKTTFKEKFKSEA